jgi:hypothetical protein
MQVQTLIKPSTSERSLGTPCQCFERLDERLRGERLCKKCDASRGQRSFANGRVLIPGNVHNRHGNACGFETIVEANSKSNGSNLYSITTNQEAIRALFRVMKPPGRQVAACAGRLPRLFKRLAARSPSVGNQTQGSAFS